MNKKLYHTLGGLTLWNLPITKKDSINQKRRNVVDIEQTTAANMISITGINPDYPMIFCGKYNKALPILRQMTKISEKPFLLIGTKRDLENSCLLTLSIDWNSDEVIPHLQQNNGKIIVKPGLETNLMIKEYISEWHTHLLILCLGNGLQIDAELLNLLNGLGHYILLSESLSRAVREFDGCKLSPTELLSSMDYILVSSIGTAAKDLMSIIPSYECEKVTNTTDFSLHNDTSPVHHSKNEGGFRISQSRTLETKSLFTQDDLTHMQDNNILMIYNAKAAHTWVAKIVR